MLQGVIRKMRSVNDNPIQYYLPLSGNEIYMNDLLHKEITMEHTGNIYCLSCGTRTKKSFAQGYCYKCFISAPETEECVLRPELCRAHEGIARDMEFAKNHCLIDHYVYLSNTSTIKVGVTRHSQIPTRWVDQGASYAVCIAKTCNRYEAGEIEVALKQHVADKTNWRNMLKNDIQDIDMINEAKKLQKLIPVKLQKYVINELIITNLTYPVVNYPEKIKTLSFDKEKTISGTLLGIKGQYLYLNDGTCLNMRKFGGYEINLSVG